MKVATKHEVQYDAFRELVKLMFNKVAYAPTTLEYDVAIKKLRSFKHHWQHGCMRMINCIGWRQSLVRKDGVVQTTTPLKVRTSGHLN